MEDFTGLNLTLKAQIHSDICTALHALYLAKNSDYGSAFEKLFAEVGDVAAYTKVADKFYRVQELRPNPDKAKVEESLRDTLLDLANYCLLWVVEMDAANHKTAVPNKPTRRVTQEATPFESKQYMECPRCGYPKAEVGGNGGSCPDCGHDWPLIVCPSCGSGAVEVTSRSQDINQCRCHGCGEMFGDKI